MTRMLLVRHGQSVWNAEGRWQGRADPELSDLGRHQAHTAAGRVGAVDVIVASPLRRAHTTAMIIGEALGIGPLVVDPDLVERDAGEWSGLTRGEIEAAWPGWLEAGRRPPGYEHDEEVLRRLVSALDRIHDAYGGAEVLVVCHGGLIYALEGHLGAPSGRIPNLGGRPVEHRGDGLALGDRVLLVGEDEVTVPAQL